MCKMALVLIITTEKLRWIKKKIAVGCLFFNRQKSVFGVSQRRKKDRPKSACAFWAKETFTMTSIF